MDKQYNEAVIKTLSSLEHIRLRPGMYIGRVGDGSHPNDGIYMLLKEIIDNSVDEFIMGSGNRIDISIAGNTVVIRDYGRGIPLGKLIECVSLINTGGKYNTDAFQFSVGLNGVGTKAVNALSSSFSAMSIRDGEFRCVVFERGLLIGETTGKSDEGNGACVEFTPDAEIFHDYRYQLDFVEKRVRMYAYLNNGLSLYLNGKRFYSRRGLGDLIDMEVGDRRVYDIIHAKDKTLEFALCHTDGYGENYFSFVNGQHTNDGGTHLAAFKEGILKAVNEFTGKQFQASDVRDGIVGAVSIRLLEPVFESQTKNKLGNTDIKGWLVNEVKAAISDFMHRNPKQAEIIIDKVKRNENTRREIQSARKHSREKAKRISIRVPKLRDCRYHRGDKSGRGEETTIFLTEGDSAAGSMVKCRNIYTQAIFSLKGKPLNVYGKSFDKLYGNEELYFIMQALNIEEDMDNLRYNKVVIATDADVDGLHIRNLLITFFLTFFDQLVLSEHLYILETPLFRVRDKKETFYCYSEEEQKTVAGKLGKSAETTRFKGLGEISPDEFAAFIGENIRLEQVLIDNMRDIPEILGFYMGMNSPERKKFITDNIVETCCQER